MAGEIWKTGITKIEPNKITIRGYSIDRLMGKISFSQAIYLVLKGELPSENVGKMLDAIFVSSIDHGITPPSALAAITVASTGASFNGALASGILSINKFHGGAIESAMYIFNNINTVRNEHNLSIDEAVKQVITAMREEKKVVFGYGHRIHTKDPRTVKLFELAEKYGIAGDYVKIAKSVEKTLNEVTGKNLPINVDGAIAAVLCELDFTPDYGNLFFILSRISGLSAHIFEEKNRYKPMRRIDPFAWEYDGPEERSID
ncbi:citrate synthase [bacterium SM23_31]|nr:MAG: citrate synthase [bacterium SM23_31]